MAGFVQIWAMEQRRPMPLRIFHWFNALVLVWMLWSGLMIYRSHDVYFIGWGSWVVVRFFPPWFYQALHLEHRLADGIAWHLLWMWPFAVNGMVYLAYTLKRGWAPAYTRRQRLAYSSAFLLGLTCGISGLALYKPVQLALLTSALGGYDSARCLHFLCALALVLFILVHLVEAVRSGWPRVRTMLVSDDQVEI